MQKFEENEIKNLAQWTMETLVTKRDCYGEYYFNHAEQKLKQKKSDDRLTLEVLESHWKGEKTIGLYTCNIHDECKYVAIDLDCHNGSQEIKEHNYCGFRKVCAVLKEKQIPFLGYESSWGGFHIWVPVVLTEFNVARRFGQWMLDIADFNAAEIFPKSKPSETKSGIGNFLRLYMKKEPDGTLPRVYDGENWLTESNLITDHILKLKSYSAVLPQSDKEVKTVRKAARIAFNEISYADLSQKQEKAKAWLETKRGSIKGMEARKYVKTLAIQLLYDFDLTVEEAEGIYCEWGQCDSQVDEYGNYYPWDADELVGYLEWAFAEVPKHGKPRGWRLKEREKKLSELPKPEIKKEENNMFEPWVRYSEMKRAVNTNWLVGEHLTTNSLNLVFGDSGCGKTFYGTNLALSIASGIPFLGVHSVIKMPIVYLIGEGNQEDLQNRIAAWLQEHEGADITDAVFAPMVYDLSDDEQTDMIIRNIEYHLDGKKCGAVFVDTLFRYFGDGDESMTKDMKRFVSRMDKIRERTGAAVIVIHHTGIDTSRERGNRSLRQSCDALINIVANKDGGMLVNCKKQRSAKEFDSYLLKRKEVVVLETDEVDYTSLVFTLHSRSAKALLTLPKAKKAATKFIWQEFRDKPFRLVELEKTDVKKKASCQQDLKFLVGADILIKDDVSYAFSPEVKRFLNSKGSNW